MPNLQKSLILVQPTSPFTKPEDFDAALDLFELGEYDSLVTGVSDHSFSWEIDETGNAIPNIILSQDHVDKI